MADKKVLLIEDEEHLAFALRFNLEAEGYTVDVAPLLEEARALLEGPYDLIVLDVMLPDGDGFDFCVEMRSQGVLTPVLMLTAKSHPQDIVNGLNAGADDYLTKPFKLPELLSRIQAMLRRQRWESSAQPAAQRLADVFSFGDNRVDFTTHEVVAQGEPADITELELRLLRYFIEREGQVVSRDELLENVWNLSPNTHTRTVDNFMVRLRKMFEPDASNPRHFVTVRGVGYRFVAEA